MSSMIDIHTHYVPNGWPDLDRGRRAAGAVAAGRVGDRGHDHDGHQGVPPDPVRRVGRRGAAAGHGRRRCPTPRSSRRRRRSSTTAEAASRPAASRGSSTTSRSRSCEPAPDRLIPFCQVPLQDTDAACRELERCVANGHRGVEIGNHVGDRDLDSEGVVTFLQHCASLDVPVFVHPWDMANSRRAWIAGWRSGSPRCRPRRICRYSR